MRHVQNNVMTMQEHDLSINRLGSRGTVLGHRWKVLDRFITQIYNGTTTLLQQKCHILDFITTDCSILLIFVLLREDF